jgi:hypothetical protein
VNVHREHINAGVKLLKIDALLATSTTEINLFRHLYPKHLPINNPVIASDSVAIAYYTEAQMSPCDCHAIARNDKYGLALSISGGEEFSNRFATDLSPEQDFSLRLK